MMRNTQSRLACNDLLGFARQRKTRTKKNDTIKASHPNNSPRQQYKKWRARRSRLIQSGVESNHERKARRWDIELPNRTSKPPAIVDSLGSQKNPCGCPSASQAERWSEYSARTI